MPRHTTAKYAAVDLDRTQQPNDRSDERMERINDPALGRDLHHFDPTLHVSTTELLVRHS
jgi:hypothetical protein